MERGKRLKGEREERRESGLLLLLMVGRNAAFLYIYIYIYIYTCVRRCARLYVNVCMCLCVCVSSGIDSREEGD